MNNREVLDFPGQRNPRATEVDEVQEDIDQLSVGGWEEAGLHRSGARQQPSRHLLGRADHVSRSSSLSS